MKTISPFQISIEAGLHAYVAGLLREWMREVEREKVRCHLPKRLGLMRLLPGAHFHLCPELFVQISGLTDFTFPEEACRLGPGEICLVPRGLPHGERIADYRGPFLNLVFAYRPEGIGFHLARKGPQGGPDIFISSHLEKPAATEIIAVLEDSILALPRKEGDRTLAVKGLLLSHFSLLLAALESPPVQPSAQSFRVTQACQTVMQNLSNPRLSVSWVARQLRTHPDYLSRLFRQALGQPLAVYIHQQRMARARELLDSSTLNIAEISHVTGYSDPSYFTRLFRQLNGTAPRAYRERVR